MTKQPGKRPAKPQLDDADNPFRNSPLRVDFEPCAAPADAVKMSSKVISSERRKARQAKRKKPIAT